MSEQQTLPMQFGVPLDQSSFLFFACLIAAIGLVYLFCRGKFGERITGTDDYVYQFLPRHLATREDYAKGFMIYFGTMAATVVLLSLIGPKNLGTLGIPVPAEVGYVAVPLAVAFIWISVLPTVPGLQAIERYLRQYAHEQAYIPTAALAVRERLAAADFNFSAYDKPDVLQSPEMRGVEQTDFTRPRRSLEHDWARLCALVYEQKSRRMAGLLESLDSGLIAEYERDLEAIESQRQSMVAEVAAYRAEKQKDPSYTNEQLRRTIRSVLYKLYTLLGCAVRLKKQPHQDIDVPLRGFGFELSPIKSRPGSDDIKLVAISVIAITVLLAAFAAVGIGRLGLWTQTPVFPKTYYQPFLDAIATLIPFGAAIITADLMRERAIRRGTWSLTPRKMRAMLAGKYIRIVLACGVVGYAGLLLWGVTLQEPTLLFLKFEAPKALLAMVTGGFYVYHLDNVDTDSRPPRPWEISWQAGLTGVCGLVAASASYDVILRAAPPEFARAFLGSLSLPLDAILFATIVYTAVGIALAWFIPKVATASKDSDPLAEAKRDRIKLLEELAVRRIGEGGASNWMATPHPALGNRPPRAAAADIEGFEHAISLLQGPKNLAA
jgi:hypothetical protein